MNADQIKNEVKFFNDNFFREDFQLIDEGFKLINGYVLKEPRKNYLFTFEFLSSTFNNFVSLDYQFASSTLVKLNKDVKQVHERYEEKKKNLENAHEAFETFLNSNSLFIEIKNRLDELSGRGSLSDYDNETKEILTRHHCELKAIYFDYFKNDFFKRHRYVLKSLKTVLNSKTYYYEKLLWRDASSSENINRKFKLLHIEKSINSYGYLLERLKIALPYTQESQYLEKCLRIYR